jgi:hypothetical protein
VANLSLSPVVPVIVIFHRGLAWFSCCLLSLLALQAAVRAGLPGACSQKHPAAVTAAAVISTAAGITAPYDDAVAAAVQQRLLSAACVKKELQSQLQDYKRHFGKTTSQ